MIRIDGSLLEGGGQILRTSLILSQIKKIPCQIFNIRKNRPKPGLQTQHLTFVNLIKEIFDSKIEGNYLGSQEITFWPGKEKKNKIKIEIKTAASLTLLLQGILPALILSEEPKEIEIKGGATDTFFSPTWDYFENVFLAFLKKLKIEIQFSLKKRGYYPEGGAEISLKSFPWKINELKEKNLSFLEKGKFQKLLLSSTASLFLKEKKVAERQISGAKEILNKIKIPLEEKINYYQTDCPGSSFFIGAIFEKTLLGADNLGKIGKRAEEIGRETALSILNEEKEGGFFDSHLADQVLIYLFLTGKRIEMKISKPTNHFETNLQILQNFFEGNLKRENQFIFWDPQK
jgi:RNA 3'-phosphate cyclase